MCRSLLGILSFQQLLITNLLNLLQDPLHKKKKKQTTQFPVSVNLCLDQNQTVIGF